MSKAETEQSFCRVAIPRDMLWAEDRWVITVGGQPINNYKTFSDEIFTYIHFTYNHSTKKLQFKEPMGSKKNRGGVSRI
ncbi:MAG: hypothetical protein QXN87_02690 [Candidatus Bathyarchaeia archaeon]